MFANLYAVPLMITLPQVVQVLVSTITVGVLIMWFSEIILDLF